MTIGTLITGGVHHPYHTGTYKAWNGLDDPNKIAWNQYTVEVERRTVDPDPSDWAMGVGTPIPSFTDDSQLRLLDKLSSAVRGHEFNAGVFLGQSGEVARSVVGTATAFAGIFRSLKRGDLEGALRFLPRSVGGADIRAARKKLTTRDIAGAHLSLVYGWIPLIHDVQAAATAMEVLANPPRRSSVVVTRKQAVVLEGSQSPSLYSCPVSGSVSRRIRYVMEEELSAARSLGLTDLLPVLHELTPYSFVVDWFVPIGTYLSNLAVIPHLKGHFEITEKYRGSGRCIAIDPRFGGSTTYEHGTFVRSPLVTSLSVPLPQFRGFSQLYNNSQRTLNAIALMRNLFK